MRGSTAEVKDEARHCAVIEGLAIIARWCTHGVRTTGRNIERLTPSAVYGRHIQPVGSGSQVDVQAVDLNLLLIEAAEVWKVKEAGC